MRIGTYLAAALCAAGSSACREAPAETPTERAPAVGAFTLHEWGLFGVSAGTPTRASAATEAAGAFHTQRSDPGLGIGGLGTLGGKPVIYLHLDEGTDRVALDVSLGIPLAKIVERFPAGASLDPVTHRTSAGWHGITAQRGRCAHPTPVPTAESLECKGTRDGFCEAAELRRYAGDGASCFEVGRTTSEVLFYRADALPTAELPIRLEREGTDWKLVGEGAARVEGPMFYIEVERFGAPVRIRRVEPADVGRPLGVTPEGTLTPADVRAALLTEATRRGLTVGEAEAFVDAWAPAYFDTCRRTGPEASGTPPPALTQVGRSLLYFAPAQVVDAMVPLTTSPRARETKRVFLVRWVDETSVLAPDPMSALGALMNAGIGSQGGDDAGRLLGPCEVSCPEVRDGAPDVTPGLSDGVVRRVMRRNFGQIRSCYAAEARTNGASTGRVVLAFIIAPDGTVATANVADTTLRSAHVERCLVLAVRRLSFPAPSPAGPVRVRIPYDFSVARPSHPR